MSTMNDGGPAFPQHDLSGYGMGPSMRGPQWTDPYNPPEGLKYTVEGMSIRDHFAGRAMTKLVELAVDDGHFSNDERGMEACALIAEASYKMADAMIAERAKGGA